MYNNIYRFTALSIDKQEVSLAFYQGKILLIVNVASYCGFTKQYAELEQLYQRYKQQGLEILAFPCNQFHQQEPDSESDIKEFCEKNFHISFPLFSKIDVNGKNAHPLYQYLKIQKPGILGSTRIKWNFTKFLVNQNSQVIKRYAPFTSPKKIGLDIAKNLVVR